MKNIRVACFSDIHLAHPRNSTKSILDALDKALYDEELMSRIDMLFIAGDLFDRLMDMNEPYLYEIELWMWMLLRACARYQVKLIVLEGTKRHDRNQSSRFRLINEMTGNCAVLDYIDKLDVLYFDDFDMHLLCVPDEWRDNASDTLEDVKELLSSRGLERVDVAIMHGMFDYQMPLITGKTIEASGVGEISEDSLPSFSRHCHDSKEYCNMVRHVIFIGHVHTYSTYKKIIAQGSFDRLAHGEEEPKGYVLYEWDGKKDKHTFIENTNARIYKTIDCTGLDLDTATVKIKKALHQMVDSSCIRIKAYSDSDVFKAFNSVTALAPLMTWSKKAVAKSTDRMKIVDDKSFIQEQYVAVTHENVEKILSTRSSIQDIKAKYPETFETCLKELLKEV